MTALCAHARITPVPPIPARPTAASATSSRWSTRSPDRADFPHAADVVERVLIYDASTLRAATTTESGRDAVMAELVRALTDGPGVVVFRGAFPQTRGVDRVSAAFEAIIAAERAARRTGQRPLRQGRRERPGVERAGEARRARSRGIRRLLRQRHHRAGIDGLARPRLPDDLAGERRPPGRGRAGSAP